MNASKGKKTALLIAGLCLLGAVLLFLAYYFIRFIRQAAISLEREPAGYSLQLEEDAASPETAEEGAILWLEGYLAQFQQFALAPQDRIDGYTIQSAEFLDYPQEALASSSGMKNAPMESLQRVDLTFTVQRHDDSLPFRSVMTLPQEDGILVQWVVWLAYDESARTLTAQDITTRSAYDMERYHASGQAERDEEYAQYREEQPPSAGQYTYKIQNGSLFVSYDAGATWAQVPLNLSQVNYYADGGHLTTNQLQEGSYVITPEKTAILYGGGDNDLRCVYSEDMGKTWSTSVVSQLFTNGYSSFVRVRYCSFPTVSDGYAIVGSDKTMSSEAQTIFATHDGGATWEQVGSGPRTTLLCGASFVQPDIGFITYHYVEGAETALYRTEDGGATWAPIPLAMDQELVPYLTQFQAPCWEDGQLVLYVDEGADSDYPAKSPVRGKFTSSDLGKTWAYQGLVEAAQEDG